MSVVNVHAAKTNLSRLIEEVEAGGEVIIARSGTPVARLVPFVDRASGEPRKLGQLSGEAVIPADFDDPLPEEVIADFEGR